MKTFTKKQASALHPKIWSATVNGTTTIVKAYLKENAAIRLGVDVEEISLSKCINNHQDCVDEIVENFSGYENGEPEFTYSIQYKN